jgi:hydrogenase-4 component B
MSAALVLACVGVLLALSVVAVVGARRSATSTILYVTSLAASLVILAIALTCLIGGEAAGDAVILPLGIPWLGARFRIDALSAFFLSVLNLGAAGASLYGVGYGRHETAPERVLPFYPAFLAGMNSSSAPARSRASFRCMPGCRRRIRRRRAMSPH